jgi:hypothetical protein
MKKLNVTGITGKEKVIHTLCLKNKLEVRAMKYYLKVKRPGYDSKVHKIPCKQFDTIGYSGPSIPEILRQYFGTYEIIFCSKNGPKYVYMLDSIEYWVYTDHAYKYPEK